MAGKREYHSEQLEKWASTQAGFSDITFTGFVPEETLKWYYEHAKAYVFPSLNEGFGLPGLEAMTHGCPVVSSNASCLPEVHGDAAHYFDPENVDEMAQKIDEVIGNDELRRRLVTKGHANLKRFSWDAFAQTHVKVFTQLLNR